jgi:polyhydroxybutyrate depolymerase
MIPKQQTRVLMLAGTKDPVVPYEGGPIRLPGPLKVIGTFSAVKRGEAVGAEQVAQDWALRNGAGMTPKVEDIPQAAGDLGVTRLTWSAPGGKLVELYQIRGGGHTWPGGPQYLPVPLIGPVVRGWDAASVILAMVKEELLAQ